MSADPAVGPVTHQDPADLLIAIEKASAEPIRPEYVEGTAIVPPQPDHQHNKAANEFVFQLRMAGCDLAGSGNGYRAAAGGDETPALVIPDFYVLRREPTELDEAYRKAHKGWYSIDVVALTGEITSSNHETDSGPKLRAYATAAVPVYVLAHREQGMAYAYSEPFPDVGRPSRSHYRAVHTVELGGKLQLPEPYPALDTGFLLGT